MLFLDGVYIERCNGTQTGPARCLRVGHRRRACSPDKTTDYRTLCREPRQGPGLPGGWEGGVYIFYTPSRLLIQWYCESELGWLVFGQVRGGR